MGLVSQMFTGWTRLYSLLGYLWSVTCSYLCFKNIYVLFSRERGTRLSAAHVWFNMNFNSSRQIWKPIQIIQLQVWLCARLGFFVRSDLYLSFFLWLFMGRLKRNWNWWPVLTFSTGLKFQLAAMATGPWKLDPDRSREKLKTATAALNWRKVAYNCQWRLLIEIICFCLKK